MDYPSFNIQGNIISGEILDSIRSEDIKYQQAGDFGLDRKTSVRDEIGIAWAAARAHWTAFKLRLDRLKAGDTGIAETRNSWMIPLLRELGYDVEKSPAFIHPDTQKTYAISHRAANLNGFPVHIMGYHDDLNQRRDTSGPRLSPHALAQEYLNVTEHVYALVTNGRFLRLLRDATRLVRLSYLEVDLEKMMEEELYSDFAILFRLLHATRMPKEPEQNEESYIEFYHQESLASGSRIREKLSKAVEESIKELANGFLKHKDNELLRQRVTENLPPAEFYLYQLRLIYRLLFLIVTEERNLVFPETRDETQLRNRKIYYEHYSIERLRKMALRLNFIDGRKHDLWEGMRTTFLLFESGKYGDKLGIKPFGSGLFSPEALGALMECRLSNASLLKVIRALTLFENDQRQLVRVNYSDLDVEEFGSVYEGLLEYNAGFTLSEGQPRFIFIKGSERSKTGSHYTPEELVKPLIRHSLDYIIEEKLVQSDKEKALLSIRVCDVACGSGHILLSAARRIAVELATVRTREDQPSPAALRLATRDVIRNCIFGVDKNPLAVELCKVALWLESHHPGEPLGFLDHHIKCGDAIVGLAHKEELENGIADEAFKTHPGDDKEVARELARRNRQERIEKSQVRIDFESNVGNELNEALAEYKRFDSLPERTPEEITEKQNAYRKFESETHKMRLQQLADAQVAQFFIPKTAATKPKFITDADYRTELNHNANALAAIQDTRFAYSTSIAKQNRFFHWFLEFPEVFKEGGFDCIIGNPPYLGGSKISGFYGEQYLAFIKTYFFPSEGLTDLISYFFRRNFSLIKVNSFFSVITTNSVYQGDSRESSLDIIYNQQGIINFAIRSIKWPGQAKLIVSLISILKGKKDIEYYLDGKKHEYISQYLDSSISNKPKKLFQNQNQCFIGSSLLGTGFVIKKEEYLKLKTEDPNGVIMFPTYNGDDLNNEFELIDKDYAIYFKDMGLQEVEKFPVLLELLRSRVLPEREKSKQSQYISTFWKFKRPTVELYINIDKVRQYYITALTTKFLNFIPVEGKNIYSHAIGVIIPKNHCCFSILQSTFHSEWSTKEGSSLANTIRYTPSDCFETFPFPQNPNLILEYKLELIGQDYHQHRRQLMRSIQLGLTKTYNAFHAREISANPTVSSDLLGFDRKTIEKRYGKEVWNLWNHLQKTPGTCSYEEAVDGIIKLRALHVEMDQAVLEAYGWSDVALGHDFYEVDYLPENDRVRYTIHPDARKEILKRLLELNHKIHEEEVKAGLWEKKGSAKKGKKSISGSGFIEEPEGGYGGLFEIPNN